MKSYIIKLLIVACCQFGIVSAWSQGAFQNFNFESAILVPATGDLYGRYQIASALPGWTGYVGGVKDTAVLYNNIFLNSSGIGLNSPGMDGNYSVFLEAGVSLTDQTPADVAIAQTGFVPVGTQSLIFLAGGGPGTFGVSLGGEQLALSVIGNDLNGTIYGANISAWSGQSAELRFTAYADQIRIGNVNIFGIDLIQFSPVAVPEPETYALCLFGVIGLWFCKRKTKVAAQG